MALNLDPSQEARQRLSKFVHVPTLPNVSRSIYLDHDNRHNYWGQVFQLDSADEQFSVSLPTLPTLRCMYHLCSSGSPTQRLVKLQFRDWLCTQVRTLRQQIMLEFLGCVAAGSAPLSCVARSV